MSAWIWSAALAGALPGCLISSEDVQEWAEYTCPPGLTECDYPYDSGVWDTADTGEPEPEDWRESCAVNQQEWATEGGCVVFDGLVLGTRGCEYVSFQGGVGGPFSARIEFSAEFGVDLDLALYLASDSQVRIAWSEEPRQTGSDAIFVNPIEDNEGFLQVANVGSLEVDTPYTMQICVDGTDLRD